MTKSIASILEKAGGFFDICYTSVGRFTPGSKTYDIKIGVLFVQFGVQFDVQFNVQFGVQFDVQFVQFDVQFGVQFDVQFVQFGVV